MDIKKVLLFGSLGFVLLIQLSESRSLQSQPVDTQTEINMENKNMQLKQQELNTVAKGLKTEEERERKYTESLRKKQDEINKVASEFEKEKKALRKEEEAIKAQKEEVETKATKFSTSNGKPEADKTSIILIVCLSVGGVILIVGSVIVYYKRKSRGEFKRYEDGLFTPPATPENSDFKSIHSEI